MQEVSSNHLQSQGVGIVIIQLPDSTKTIPLYPVHYIPNNPQNTLSPSAIKYYNKYKYVEINILKSITFITNQGTKHIIKSDQTMIKHNILDYIHVSIVRPSSTKETKAHPTSDLQNNIYDTYINIPNQCNATSFPKTSQIDIILIHRRMMNLSQSTITKMYQEQTLNNLPKCLPPNTYDLCQCTICWKEKYNHPAKGTTQDTTNLLPGQLLHMDFKFYNILSIRGFSSIFTIIDAATRKLWCFPGPDKRPPIAKMNYFFHFLKLQNTNVHEVRVDEGGELARSTDFLKAILIAKA